LITGGAVTGRAPAPCGAVEVLVPAVERSNSAPSFHSNVMRLPSSFHTVVEAAEDLDHLLE
jgi:hypothetical protein